MAKLKNRIKLDPYIKLYGSNGVVFPYEPDTFKYTYKEEGDDECTLTFNSANPYLADNPYLQEGQRLIVEWGYNSTQERVSRTVIIFDTVTSYGEEGIQLTLTCHEKFTLTKINRSSTSVGETLKPTTRDTQTLVLGFDVLNQVSIEVEKGNKELEGLLKSAGIEVKNNKVAVNSAGWVDNKTSSALGYQSNQNVGLEHSSGTQVNERAKDIKPSMERIYFSPNTSTYKLLVDVLKRLPGGPYIVESRDERVTIKSRDFSKAPTKSYTYRGEDGELLSMQPQTKNRRKSHAASKTSSTGWDPKSKKAFTSNSNKRSGVTLADGNTQNSVIYSLWFNRFQDRHAATPTMNNQFSMPIRKKQEPIPEKQFSNYGPDWWYNELARNERANRVDFSKSKMAELGGKLPTYRPEDEEETTTTFEVWEIGGVTPGSLDGTVGARDNARVDMKRPKPLLPSRPGTPEKKSLLGSEKKERVTAHAKNTRENKELENNPASAVVVGNPYLESGQIITFLGLAKKHSGNYYVKSVEHSIDSSGYLTTISEMVRQGPMKSTSTVQAKTAERASDAKPLTTYSPTEVSTYSKPEADSQVTVNLQVGPKIQDGKQQLIQKGVMMVNTEERAKTTLQTLKSKNT